MSKNKVRVRKGPKRVERLHVMYLKDGTVDDRAERLCILLPLGVGSAGVRWSSWGQGTLSPRELPSKGGHTVFHISFRCDEVVMLVPG